jgi:hypothetical protein
VSDTTRIIGLLGTAVAVEAVITLTLLIFQELCYIPPDIPSQN